VWQGVERLEAMPHSSKQALKSELQKFTVRVCRKTNITKIKRYGLDPWTGPLKLVDWCSHRHVPFARECGVSLKNLGLPLHAFCGFGYFYLTTCVGKIPLSNKQYI